ncbi:MAG: pSer/pThr/pTyr-binding forkhead associated (FHA) protein [Kiritimatiellia bacterium]|jgi:pSer/pThr/pTyr-binding forkhead associated (FHA) protein
MRLSLKVTEGPEAGREVVVEAGDSLIVGRASEAGLSIENDGELSRLHFSIIPEGDGFKVKDLNSANGTDLNGKPVQLAPLIDGDKIAAGVSHFNVEIEGLLEGPQIALDQTAVFERPELPPTGGRKPLGDAAEVDPATRAVILVVISGPHKGSQYVIDRGHAAVVGRAPEANIHLEMDDELSKVHFSIAFKHDRIKLKDLGSANGTLVNKRLVKNVHLRNGDFIEAGASKFHLQHQHVPLDEDFEEDNAALSDDFRHLKDTHIIDMNEL